MTDMETKMSVWSVEATGGPVGRPIGGRPPSGGRLTGDPWTTMTDLLPSGTCMWFTLLIVIH